MRTTTIEEYISLPKGKTFLRWDIPQSTEEDDPSSHHHLPIFLMLHGATVPNWQFDAIVSHLLEKMAFSSENDDYITAAANDCDIDDAKPNHYNIDTFPNRTSVKTAMDAPTVSNIMSFRPHCILRIDLYGHGRSARPNVEYDLDLFVEQVLGVISELGHSPNNSVNDNGNHESNCNTTTTTSCSEANNNFNASIQMDKVKFHTRGMIGIGHSMGAAILSSVAYELATKSKREQSTTSSSIPYFRKLILAAPMLDYLSLHPESRLLFIPYIGEKLIHHVIVPKLIDRRRKRYGAIGRADLAERFFREISVASSDGKELTFPEALLRMFRHGAVGDQSDSYIHLGELLKRYGRLDGRDEGKCVGVDCNEEDGRLKKVHVIWGSRDDVANEDQIYDILGSLGRLRTTCRKDSEEDRAALESRGVTFRVMKGLEHNLLMSHPELCADSIVDALQDNVF